MRAAFTAAVVGLAATATAASPACCAYDGTGAATFAGTATIDLGSGRAALLPATMSVDPSSSSPFVSVLLGGATPFAAEAGWIITANTTHQVMTVWQNNTASSKAVCAQDATPLSAGYVPGFAMCPGSAGSLFPTAVTSFAAGAVGLNVFAQGAVGSSTGIFTGNDAGCAIVSVLSPGAPVGSGGAFSLTVTAGSGAAPPAALGVPPAACGF